MTDSQLYAQGAGALVVGAPDSRLSGHGVGALVVGAPDSRLAAEGVAALVVGAPDSRLAGMGSAALVTTRWDIEVLLAGAGGTTELDSTSPTPRSVTLVRPTGVPPGSLLLAHLWYRGPAAELVVPAGWTVESGPWTGGIANAVICSRLAIPSDPVSWTWTTGDEANWRGGGRILAFSPGAVIDALSHNESTTSNTSLLPTPPLTFSEAGAVFVACHMGFGDMTFTDSTGTLVKTTDGLRFAQFWRPGLPAGAYDPSDIDTSGSTQSAGYVTFTVALRSGLPRGNSARRRVLAATPVITHRATASFVRQRRAWTPMYLYPHVLEIGAGFTVDLSGGTGTPTEPLEIGVLLTSTLDVQRAPVPPPAGISPVMLRRYSETYPDPVPVAGLYTRPDPELFRPTSVVEEVLGRIAVFLDGVDRTFVDGVPVLVEDWSHSEPWGWETCQLQFPQRTALSTPGAWPASSGARLELALVSPTDAFVRWLWRGFVAEVRPGLDGVSVTGLGLLKQASLAAHQPDFWPSLKDIGRAIPDALNRVVSRRYGTTNYVGTGIETSKSGARTDTVTTFCTSLLGMSTVDDGTTMWTVLPRQDGTPVMLRKDITTVQWTVTLGARGVRVELGQDLLQDANVIYGSGVTDEGEWWANSRWPGSMGSQAPPYPNHSAANVIRQGETDRDTDNRKGVSQIQGRLTALGFRVAVTGSFGSATNRAVRAFQKSVRIQVDGIVGGQTWNALWEVKGVLGNPFYMPIAAQDEVIPFRFDASGAVIGSNPAYDRSRIRVEEYYSFGAGVDRTDATRWAEAQLARNRAIPGLSGAVYLTADPREGSRHLIEAGQNIRVRGWGGVGNGIVLHVARSRSRSDGQVDARVSTRFEDLYTLEQITARKRDAVDPAGRILAGARESSTERDTSPWFAEAPAGIVPRTAAFGGLISVLAIPMGKYGSVVRTLITTSPRTEFALMAFSRRVTSGQIRNIVGNPLSETSAGFGKQAESLDRLKSLGYLMGWGASGSAAGYDPAQTSSTGGQGKLTGKLDDTSSWQFAAENGQYIYLAIYCSKSTFYQVRLYVSYPVGEK